MAKTPAPMSERRLFVGSGGHRLAARLDRPHGPIRACAVLVHCFTCGKDLRVLNVMSRTFTARGLCVLRFDLPGIGESEGDFAGSNYSSSIADIVAAAEYLEGEIGPVRLVVGHSLGGAAALAAVGMLPSVTAVATIGAPFRADHIRALLRSAIDAVERDGAATVAIAGRSFTITKQFLDDLDRADPRAALQELGRPLLVIHAVDDTVVPLDNAFQLFNAARDPKALVSVEGADHLLSDRTDAAFVAEVIAVWASRYIPPTGGSGGD